MKSSAKPPTWTSFGTVHSREFHHTVLVPTLSNRRNAHWPAVVVILPCHAAYLLDGNKQLQQSKLATQEQHDSNNSGLGSLGPWLGPWHRLVLEELHTCEATTYWVVECEVYYLILLGRCSLSAFTATSSQITAILAVASSLTGCAFQYKPQIPAHSPA
jgi:hypothetical protein